MFSRPIHIVATAIATLTVIATLANSPTGTSTFDIADILFVTVLGAALNAGLVYLIGLPIAFGWRKARGEA
jgi:hypothetical protein